MFCPVCRYEFRRGFTKCNECGVDLVDALPPEADESAPDASKPPEQRDSPTLLWRDYDSATFNEIRLALDSAGIPYNREELDARLLFTDAYNPLEIWVPAANLSEAEQLRDQVISRRASSPASGAQPAADDFALPAEDDEASEDIRSEDVARELDPAEATAEIWSGADASIAEILKSCLAEIGIACYVNRSESGNLAVRVLPGDEKRACHIVRQVVEGVPPE
jgi:hypothetical protein